jgi:predicted phage terminase large subunit-like protein
MQDPQPLEGLIFAKSELQYYEQLPDKIDLCIIVSDPADEGIDYHSAPVLLVSNGIVYVEDVIFTKDNLTLVEPQIIAFDKRYKPDLIVIESNNAGALFIRDLRKKISTSIFALKNTTNKIVRILAQEGFIKENFRFKKEYPANSPYALFMKQIHNILRNGQEKRDDAPDSIASGAFMLRRNYQALFDKTK